MSLNMIIVFAKDMKFEDKTRRKPKRTGGGGRTGDARKDGSQPVSLDSAT